MEMCLMVQSLISICPGVRGRYLGEGSWGPGGMETFPAYALGGAVKILLPPVQSFRKKGHFQG